MKYVGNPSLHDGSVESIDHVGSTVEVRVRSSEGDLYVLRFAGVEAVEANRPVGMLLYAFVEESGDEPHRRFVFANWDEDDDAMLTVVAQAFEIDAPDA
jgi:hypothetical protein